MTDDFRRSLAEELRALESTGNLRTLRVVENLPAGRARWEGKEYLNLAGNDYLGIASDLAWRKEFYLENAEDLPALSAASSRLLTGNTPEYAMLEAELSGMYGNRSALVFNSGYHANIGILPALARKGDLVLSDKLNHASLIDGLRLLDAEYKRYAHNDYGQLERLLAGGADAGRRVFIVCESIFSMDGDRVDLRKIVELKKRYGSILYVDEAHAVGVLGASGGGLAEYAGLMNEVDILVGTFGKAWGSTGAYAIVEPEVREYLVNRMRSLIFSTGLPPAILRWSLFVLKRRALLAPRRARLAVYSAQLRAKLSALGFATCGDSQVIPLLVGDAPRTVALAARLQERGILVFPIRPPTVPSNSSRLRFSLNAALEEEDFARLLAALDGVAHAL